MPTPDALTLYLLGPGIGESVVLVMPDARVVVVDSCERGEVNLPASLLARLGIEHIDLLVVTHPDLDHIRGIHDLVRRFSPRRIWRYPFGLLREVLRMLGPLETPAGNRRYAEALRAHDALDERLRASGTVERVHFGRPWQPPGSSYAIHALAPTHYDVERATSKVHGLLEKRRGRLVLSEHGRACFSGEKALGDLPNMVSLGLVVEWCGRKILLGGDVERGDGSPHSGWRGVLAALDQPDERLGHLVDDVDVIKVAHHGSSGALFEGAWSRHARSSKPVALATTYSPSVLPDDEALQSLRAWAKRLGLTTDAGDVFERALAAGWVAADPHAAPTLDEGPCLEVVIHADGSLMFGRGAEASWLG